MWCIHYVFLKILQVALTLLYQLYSYFTLQMSNYSVPLSIVNKLNINSSKKHLLSKLDVYSYIWSFLVSDSTHGS